MCGTCWTGDRDRLCPECKPFVEGAIRLLDTPLEQESSTRLTPQEVSRLQFLKWRVSTP